LNGENDIKPQERISYQGYVGNFQTRPPVEPIPNKFLMNESESSNLKKSFKVFNTGNSKNEVQSFSFQGYVGNRHFDPSKDSPNLFVNETESSDVKKSFKILNEVNGKNHKVDPLMFSFQGCVGKSEPNSHHIFPFHAK
jgi:hypothetical protein